MTSNTHRNFAGSKASFVVVLGLGFAVALVGMMTPFRHMPIDFHLVLWASLPLAGVWLTGSVGSSIYFGRKALWMLLGAPFALYWPVWLLFNRIPVCYWHQNCI